MARTVQQQLEDVDAAIAKVEVGGQAYSSALGTTVTRANLATLYARRDELQGLVTLAELGGGDGVGRVEIGLSGADPAR